MVLQAAIHKSGVDPQVKFESSDHGDVVLAGLTKLRNMEQLFDVVLIVENERFPAHRVVLASCSDYFRAMFTDGLLETSLDEIQLNGVTALGMRNLIDFAYSSKILIDSENVEHVLSAANHVQILPVVEACVKYLKTHLVLTNCVDMITISELFSLSCLRSHVYKYVSKNLASLAISSEFLRLSSCQLENLLDMNFPVDCAEIDVFSAVIGWIVHHHGNSAKLALKYLRKVNINGLRADEIQMMHNFTDFEKMLFNSNGGLELQAFMKAHLSTNIVKVDGLLNIRGYKESLVICGGFLLESGMTNKIQYYDERSGTLHYLTTVPHVEQCNFGMTSVNNKLYIIGGCYNDEQMEEIEHGYGFCYNPETKQWKTIPPMIDERCRFYLGAINNKLYAIGGDPSASYEPAEYAKCECFDSDTNRWSPIAMMPGNRSGHAGTVLGDNLFISGGIQDPVDPQSQALNSFYKYNPCTDTWTQLAAMFTPRTDHTMFTYDGKIYVIGGCFEDRTTRHRVMVETIDSFDLEKGQWEQVTRVPNPRLYASYTVFRDQILIMGGWFDGDYQQKCKHMQTYDLKSGTWKVDTNSSMEIWEHASCNIYLPNQ